MTKVIEDSDNIKPESGQTGNLPFYKSPENVSPPVKPLNKGSKMSKKTSSNYEPNIPRKVVDIPNSTIMRSSTSQGNNGEQLIVGKTITINGDISSCKTLIVEGKVEANVFDVVSLNVAPGGIFKGNAKVTNAFIAGDFDGSLETTKTLEIAETGKVNGDIKYQSICIASGGVITGNISVKSEIDIKK
tara:strand:- start:24 stop:587 length:564 start_codon:yes stop_codon:yes gene_type:complete